MKAVVAAFNQEKALVGAFSVITNLRMELFQALAQACLKQRGQFRAVCSSLSSVRPFLDIGRLLDYDEQDSMEI